MFDWIRRIAQDTAEDVCAEEMVHILHKIDERFDVLQHKALLELRKEAPIATERNSLKLSAKTANVSGLYSILDTTTQQVEHIDGWLDTSDLKDGDKVEFKFTIRLDAETERLWWKTTLEGDQTTPALRIANLLAPRGVKITMQHLTGREFTIGWYLRRSA